MTEHLSALAANVKRLRESHGLSLAQLADRTGVAKATLFKIESQRTNPTLSTLTSLSTAFSVPVAQLITPPGADEIDVVREGDGLQLDNSPARAVLRKSMLIGQTLVEILDLHIEPGDADVTVTHGPGAREHVLVRSGHMIVGPIGAQVNLGPGDYATYPSDRPHQWVAAGDELARAWVVHTFVRPITGG
ncbi:MAG: helix-turn-helix domain-containing protein [Solirubrobacteraceae bacterium]